jgi:metal-responsive CopG/Arc/MetJ family transcriptional regulator
MTKKRISFSCPTVLVEAIDRIARDEMSARSSVIRRALQWEARACGETVNVLGPPNTEPSA